MTSIEWFMEKIGEKQPNGFYVIDTLEDVENVFNKAKEMHKQEIINFANNYSDNCIYCSGEFAKEKSAEEYYQETFVSKGSDDHISDISKMVDVPKQEISDEEIKKSMHRYNITDFGQMAAYITGAQWYREQLKQK